MACLLTRRVLGVELNRLNWLVSSSESISSKMEEKDTKVIGAAAAGGLGSSRLALAEPLDGEKS